MKTILSLILPENSVFRYLRKGRKGIGFKNGVLVTRSSSGVETTFQGDLATTDLGTNNDSTTIATRLFTYTGTASGKTLTLPAVNGAIREVTILNMSNQTVAVAGATGKVVAGTAAGNGYNLTTGQATRLVSTGAFWYRVSLS